MGVYLFGDAFMCDYSLAEVRSRLAVEGEDLTVYRFPTGTLGFTSPVELAQRPELRGWRARVYGWMRKSPRMGGIS